MVKWESRRESCFAEYFNDTWAGTGYSFCDSLPGLVTRNNCVENSNHQVKDESLERFLISTRRSLTMRRSLSESSSSIAEMGCSEWNLVRGVVCQKAGTDAF